MKITNPYVCRELSKNKDFISIEMYKAENDGHKYKSGDICILTGLEDFPEFNGDKVEITSIREDGSHGKAYYIKGSINEFLNWVYEYRLEPTTKQ